MQTKPIRHRLMTLLIVAATIAFGIASAAPTREARVEVPFEMLPSNHMVVQVSLNGEGPFRLIFDVGSPVTLISNRAAKESGIIEGDAPFAFLFAARGEAEVETIQVGNLSVEDVPVIVMDHPVVKALGDLTGKPIDGLVGHSFFARYRTTIDYQSKVMAFEPVEHDIRDFVGDLPDRLTGPKVARRIVLEPSALLGLSIEDTEDDGNDGVTVRSVLPGSPAEAAGLRAGDLITSIDGRWTVDVADAYTAASKLEPGEAVQVLVRRDGRETTLQLTPRAGI